jgi:F-type H+-transporting ATPase subunit b
MMINWSTILFQIINFIVLVFLLKKFLYGPIVSVMEQREQEILEREANAQQKLQKAEQTSKDYQHRIEKFENEKEENVKLMHQEIKQQKQKLVKESKEEISEAQDKMKEDINQQVSTHMKQLKEQLSIHACDLAKKTLNDLADASLEAIVLDVFIKKLKNLSEQEMGKITKALKRENKAHLVSSFELSEKQEKTIKDTINQIADSQITMSYSTNKNLGCGTMLEFEGYQISWNTNNYLNEIEKKILLELPKSNKGGNDEPK